MTEQITRFDGFHEFLSNFHMTTIEFEGIIFLSSEHAFQAAKTLDMAERRKISALSTPGQAKRAGRRVTLRPDWNDIRIGVMAEILRIKFAKPDLRKELLDTGDAELIEGNLHKDTFWGVCDGKGHNHLGIILMEIRDEIRRNQQ